VRISPCAVEMIPARACVSLSVFSSLNCIWLLVGGKDRDNRQKMKEQTTV
jgi:hypothetical protein